MALIKSRPRIRVRVPNEIRPGDEVPATIVLDCKSELAIEHVDVLLVATERWMLSGSKSSQTRELTLLRLGARIAGARTLSPGPTELAVRLPLPDSAPPSYRGTHAVIDYTLSVHVSIDWWPDANASFEIKVVPPPAPSPETVPLVYSSDPTGPKGEEAHVELSLASSWTRAGDIVTGALALANVEKNRYSEIVVALAGVETVYYGAEPRGVRDHVRYEVRLGVEQAREGEMIPFQFRVPADATPELAAHPRPEAKHGLVSLAWSLEATVKIRWGGNLVLRIPFRLLPPSSHPGDAPLRMAPPTVGSDRLRASWEKIGAALGLRYEAQSLRAEVGETALSLRRDHQGRGGVFLVAELTYPELHLGLSVEPASALRKLAGGGVLVGDHEWDHEHYVTARDDAQAHLVIGALFPALKGARIRRIDDRQIVVELRDAGQRPRVLHDFAESALGLAREVERLRRALPPPTAMVGAVEEWNALAAALGAPLETARMRIEGRVGPYVAEVRTSFDGAGAPLHTWLAIAPATPFDATHAFRWRTGEGAASDAIARRFTGRTAELVALACQDALELCIERERVMLCLPSPLGAPGSSGVVLPVREADRRLERMAQIANALRGHAGPYR